jgi:O-antigen ligase
MLGGLDRGRWSAVIDWLAVGVAVSLPWSTSATSILVVLWILAALPTLDLSARRDFAEPAAFLPVLLWVLAAVGMLWADVSFADRLAGLSKFHRLLVIPLLLFHFRRSERGVWVIYGFFAASVALLLVSWGLAEIPGLPWRGRSVGVPTKDYIFQAMNFLICALALLGYACDAGRGQRRRSALVAVLIALLFLANILFVVTSRTALLVLPVLLLWQGWREFRWRGIAVATALAAVIGAGAWFESPYLHNRLTKSVEELDAYRASNAPN